jgi:hypothetical protein
MISVRVEQSIEEVRAVHLIVENPDCLIFFIDTKQKYPEIVAYGESSVYLSLNCRVFFDGINFENSHLSAVNHKYGVQVFIFDAKLRSDGTVNTLWWKGMDNDG